MLSVIKYLPVSINNMSNALPTMPSLTLCLLLSASFITAHSQLSVSVDTKRGTILGLRWDPNPATGVSYDSFIGIPYGKIPARYQLAVPRDSWSLPLITQTDGPPCPQSHLSYSEDCLFLNVFTPLNAFRGATKYPVMAFIHGSGFTVSSSSSREYGPDFLVNASVILVTMNYRLGAAGFLTLGSKMAPGNLGLQDTRLAMQWIQDEIAGFGGDPSQVTLFGESAGSAMVQFHYLSDNYQGLFARAIGQSGSALAEWGLVTATEGARRAKLLAVALGCDTTKNDTVVLACLQKADIKDIVGNQFISLPTNNVLKGSSLPFVPVLDSYLTADKPFFNDTLANLMKQALTRSKPLMTGFNTDEGIMKFDDNVWKGAEANLAAFKPQTAAMVDDNKAATEIRSRYFPDTPDQNKVEDIVRLYRDVMFAYPSVKMSRYFANMTYGYLFAYDGSWVTLPLFFSQYRLSGVNHGEELSYLFYINGSVQYLDNCTTNIANLKMKQQMVKWWTTFAKTGVPDASWQNVASGGYLVIDSTTSKMNSSAFESEFYSFWANLETGNSCTSSAKLSITVVLWGWLLSIFIKLQFS